MGIVPVDKTCNEIVLAGGKALQDFIDEMDLGCGDREVAEFADKINQFASRHVIV